MSTTLKSRIFLFLLVGLLLFLPGNLVAQNSPVIVYINSNSVNARDKADLKSKVYRTLSKYEAFEVANVKCPSGWTPIKYEYYDSNKEEDIHTTAFVNSKYVIKLENSPIPKALIKNKSFPLATTPKRDVGGSLNFWFDGNKFNVYYHISVLSWVRNGGSGTADWADINGEWVEPGYLKILDSKRMPGSRDTMDKIVVYDKSKGLLLFGGRLWKTTGKGVVSLP